MGSTRPELRVVAGGCSSSARGADAGPSRVLSGVALEPLLLPDVPPLVVAVHLPVAIPVVPDELDPVEPLRALPPVEFGHEWPCGETLLDAQGLPVDPERDDGVFVEGVLDWYWCGIAVEAVEHYPLRVLTDAGGPDERWQRDPLPLGILDAPFGYTVPCDERREHGETWSDEIENLASVFLSPNPSDWVVKTVTCLPVMKLVDLVKDGHGTENLARLRATNSDAVAVSY